MSPFLLVGAASASLLVGMVTGLAVFATVVAVVTALSVFGVDATAYPSDWVLALIPLWVVTTLLFGWRRVRRRAGRETAATLVDTRPAGDDPVEREAARTLRRLCQQAGVPTPALRVREVERPTCLTVRYRPSAPPGAVVENETPTGAGDELVDADYAVVVSTGLLAVLSERGRTAVLAHEVAHLSNWDLALTNAVLAPLYTGEVDVERDPHGALWFGVPVLVMRVAFGVAAVVFVRGREFAADHAAARLTGDPAGLAMALRILDGDVQKPTADLRAAHFLNVTPIQGGGWIRRHSHPPTHERVERLRGMVGT